MEQLPIKYLAGCVIYDKDGKLLLIHRNKPNLVQWELPGGKIDPGESAETTAVREVKEEICVDVVIIKKLGSANFEHRDIDWHYTWFEATIVSGQVPKVGEPDTFDDLAYWDISEIKKRKDISPNVINLMKIL